MSHGTRPGPWARTSLGRRRRSIRPRPAPRCVEKVTDMNKRILVALVSALTLLAAGSFALGSATKLPIRGLVFSGQMPGSIYYHDESIAREKKEFPKWAPEFHFDFADCNPPGTGTSPVICNAKQ